MLPGPFINPDNRLRAPPCPHDVLRSKTVTKPRRSSPLAGPAVMLVNTNENVTIPRASSFCASPTPSLAMAPEDPSRPTSMQFDYSSCPSFQPSSRPHIVSSDTDEGFQEPNSATTIVAPVDSTINEKRNSIRTGSVSFRKGRDYHKSRRTGDYNIRTLPLSLPTVANEDVGVSALSVTEKAEDLNVSNENPQILPTARVKSKTGRTLIKDNSWYITNTYTEVPKFSRLGLSSSNVVLPVSAKEYRKQHTNRHSKMTSDAATSLSSNVSNRTSRSLKRQSVIGLIVSSCLGRTESEATGQTPLPGMVMKSQRTDSGQKVVSTLPLSSPPLPTFAHSYPASLDSSQRNTLSRSLTEYSSTSTHRISSSAHSALSTLSSSQTSFSKEATSTRQQHHSESCTPVVAYTTSEELADKVKRRKSFIARMKGWTTSSSTVPVDGLNSTTRADFVPSKTSPQMKREKLHRIGSVKAFFRFFVVSG